MAKISAYGATKVGVVKIRKANDIYPVDITYVYTYTSDGRVLTHSTVPPHTDPTTGWKNHGHTSSKTVKYRNVTPERWKKFCSDMQEKHRDRCTVE
jgi:hypothetical protein